MKQSHADVSVCSFDNRYVDGGEPNPIVYPQGQSFSREQFLQRFLSDWTSGMAVNKLFKRSVLKGVYYEEGHKIDDEFFTYKAILRSRKIVMFDESLYHYRMRRSSVMHMRHEYYEQMLLDRMSYLELRYQDVKNDCPILKLDFYKDLVFSIRDIWLESFQKKKIQAELKRWKRRNLFKVFFAKMPLKIKLGCIKVLYFTKPKQLVRETQETTKYTCFA